MHSFYFDTLFALFRDRGENPVARATLPWRGSPRRRVLFWGLLAATTALSLLGGWSARMNTAAWGHLYAYYAAFAAIPLSTALALQLFGFRHRALAELEDLALTQLTREEVAFGAVYGAVMASGWFALPVMAGYAIAAASVAAEFPYRLVVLLLLWVAMVGTAVRAWILAFGRVLHLFLYSAAFAVGLFLLAGMDSVYPSWRLGIQVAMGVVAVVLARQAGRFAGLRFFAPLDWEALCRAYWLTNELVAFFEFEERKAAMKELRRRNRARPYDVLGGWLVGFLVLWAFSDYIGSLLTEVGSISYRSYPLTSRPGDLVGIVVASTASVMTALGIRVRKQGGVLWMPSGSIHLCMVSHLLTPLLPFALLAILGAVTVQDNPFAGVPNWRFLAAVGLGVSISGGVFLLASRSRAPVNTLVLSWLLLLAFLFVFFGRTFLETTFEALFAGIVSQPVSTTGPLSSFFRWEKTILIFLGCFSAALLAFWPRFCQGIHERYLQTEPRHTLVAMGKQTLESQ